LISALKATFVVFAMCHRTSKKVLAAEPYGKNRNSGPSHPWIWLGWTIVIGAAMAALPLSAAAGELPPEEVLRVEVLIAAVEGLADAVFIRNGHAYDSAVAAEFLRRKWKAKASNVGSAEDFIATVASFSSTTGQAYLIRWGDGREVPCSVFLRHTLEKTGPERP
jgi:hypothetical protein